MFIPPVDRPGVEAEVDFGDVYVKLAGVSTKCSLFTFRLSYSGKAVHRIFVSEGQKAFFEGHVHAFRVLGGVPTGKVRYDKPSSAVAQVLGFTRARVEPERWTAFHSHFGLEFFYCRPGLKGAYEKGGVEGEVGRLRRNHRVVGFDLLACHDAVLEAGRLRLRRAAQEPAVVRASLRVPPGKPASSAFSGSSTVP